jgi:hypothetical protein
MADPPEKDDHIMRRNVDFAKGGRPIGRDVPVFATMIAWNESRLLQAFDHYTCNPWFQSWVELRICG